MRQHRRAIPKPSNAMPHLATGTLSLNPPTRQPATHSCGGIVLVMQNSRVGQATVCILEYIRKHPQHYMQTTGSGVPERVLR